MTRAPHEAAIGAGRFTYDDLVNLPDDGKRYEILDGDLVVTPSPATRHQIVSSNLGFILQRHIKAKHLGRNFYPRTDVILDAHTVVEPDIVFVSAARSAIIRAHAIVGAPDLVIEVLSPSTTARDRGTKAKLYARFAVEHYWIVGAEEETLEVFCLAGNAYGPASMHARDAIVRTPAFPELAIDLREVWE